ncbi:uncharacterized protein [Acropora muricata]|uniref:uncharacterized protein n=1 Tax=Acropora muricata TaxID=159855 RepID=UPI0034E59056
MVAHKDLFVLLVLSYQIVFLKFVIGGPTKELVVRDHKINDVQKDLLLRSWIQSSERQQLRRAKRQARYPKRKLKFDLPYYPLYPIDLPVCKDAERESNRGLCKSWAKSGFCLSSKNIMKKYCSKECKYCKPYSPPGCTLSKHGCCWTNSPAQGHNGHGCPRCMDAYTRLCRLFTLPDFNYCSKPGKEGRFVRYNCFQSCGWCDNFRQIIANQTRNAI